MAEDQMPMKITQQEFMRRMKDMSSMSGMNFYGEMPDSYNLVVNSNHPLILDINTKLEETLGNDIQSIDNQIKPLKDEITKLNDQNKDKKEEDISTADKDKIEALEKEVSELEESKENKLKEYGKNQKLVKQIIDLALLSNNMLKGESLNLFVKRSIELIGN